MQVFFSLCDAVQRISFDFKDRETSVVLFV